MEELSPRQQALFTMIVRDYISSANPVGSQAIARHYRLGLSSATIRNEMAELERNGYIAQPHTSAGRVPTDKGYRYFVSRLMDDFQLPDAEQRTIQHQFHQVERELDQWLQLAASVLARTAHNVALVTMPTARQCRLRHLELLPMQGSLVLLVAVFQEGRLHRQLLNLPAPDPEPGRVAHRLTDVFARLSAPAIEAKIAHGLVVLSPAERTVVDHLVQVMRQVDVGSAQNAYYDGLLEILTQPEFAHADKIRGLVAALEKHDAWTGFVPNSLPSGEVWLTIGTENSWILLRDCSLVLARYGHDDTATGVLGIIGPTRMSYWRAIATVRYLSGLVGNLVTTLASSGPN